MNKRLLFLMATIIAGAAASSGCSRHEAAVPISEYGASQLEYPSQPLRVPCLTKAGAAASTVRSPGSDVFIFVHPGYSVFIDSAHRGRRYPGKKLALARRQYENEARFIEERARSGSPVILVVPADDNDPGDVPASYHFYLNRVAANSPTVFYTVSETMQNGTLPMEDMVALYRFLEAAKPRNVFIGGGYVGRCQFEFLQQFTRYFDVTRTFLLPEVSTVSPEDLSEREAAAILASIGRGDYGPLRSLIESRTEGRSNVRFLTGGGAAEHHNGGHDEAATAR